MERLTFKASMLLSWKYLKPCVRDDYRLGQSGCEVSKIQMLLFAPQLPKNRIKTCLQLMIDLILNSCQQQTGKVMGEQKQEYYAL